MVLRKAKLKRRKRQGDPSGTGGVKVVKSLAFWSPDGHSDCKLSMKMALGSWRAGRGAENFFDDCHTVFCRFMLAREAAQVGSERLGKGFRSRPRCARC